MKKILFAFVLLLNLNVSNASFVDKKARVQLNETASDKTQTTTLTEKPHEDLAALSVEQILALTPSAFEKISGKKMSFKDKLALKFIQKDIKRDLNKNGHVDLKDYIENDKLKFNLGGFALGLFLGLIGVALAYIFSNNKSFRRSSWHGVVALVIIILIVAAASVGSN